MTPGEQIAKIDGIFPDIHYRSAFHRDELEVLFEGLPVDWTPYREYFTRSEVEDMLLDTRSTVMGRMNVTEETDGELQEELNALVGANLDASRP